MSSISLDLVVTGLQAVVREHGLARSCADASWLQNILADHSPRTPALNRVAAVAAREGVPGWLQSAAPGAVDDVVARAVSRLASEHGVDQGVAHDAVSAWARALGVLYSGTRPTSVTVRGAGVDRVARRIQKLLDIAEAAEDAGRWQEALEAYNDVLAADATHAEAPQLRAIVLRRLGGGPSAAPAPAIPVMSTLLWRASWMSDCGEDAFGRWAAVSIAGVEHRFRYCAPGVFKMGSPASEVGRLDTEGPQHTVALTHGFWLGEAPVTQRQWAAVTGSNPSHFKGNDLPVEQVSWHDCEAWMAQASGRVGGLRLRFPTEAEWEYACRAGTTGATYRGGHDAATLDAIAWYGTNSGGKTHPVKQKAPNPWGLYDILGNVWEWCMDSKRRYDTSALVDPSGGANGERVNRGGSWGYGAPTIRAAFRRDSVGGLQNYYVGLRLARGQ